MATRKIQPAGLFQRALNGRVLYSHVVVAAGQSLIFISGQLARDQDGQHRRPARHARARSSRSGRTCATRSTAAGATLDDLVKTTTFVTDIDEFFKHVDVRHDYLGWRCRRAPRSRSAGSPTLT